MKSLAIETDRMNHGYTPTHILAQGTYTELAVALNESMACDPLARWDYLFEYGVSWEPLPTPGLVSEPLTALASPLSNATILAGLQAINRR